ncbi:hypothetical protein E4L96_04870 [Massilia arenosa]|uniref:Uncharacterized protein n=1 Tax=Zemynaea arenosa TaxID=2561931 RepID=A0A4Y9SJ24_9BURK|nr:hypothetical protein E4L96_04870 [Massilia arenosa]
MVLPRAPDRRPASPAARIVFAPPSSDSPPDASLVSGPPPLHTGHIVRRRRRHARAHPRSPVQRAGHVLRVRPRPAPRAGRQGRGHGRRGGGGLADLGRALCRPDGPVQPHARAAQPAAAAGRGFGGYLRGAGSTISRLIYGSSASAPP